MDLVISLFSTSFFLYFVLLYLSLEVAKQENVITMHFAKFDIIQDS